MKTFIPELTDEVLVQQSLTGKVEAFAQIVQRYQVLLCSVAYSFSGNVAQSEDIAQETFIAAWRQLPQLREPAKLKAWLCGIARHRISMLRRKEKNHATEPLDAANETSCDEPLPNENATRSDDEAIAWRALELVPEIYREALVLYYREHQSIEHVAVLLDLNEETVRQRLSRGRKALQDQVLSLLGTTLTKTAPALAFTSSVLSALPISATASASASAGGAAAKAGMLKTVSALGLGASAAAMILGYFGVALGNRVAMEMAKSSAERALMKQRGQQLWFIVAGLTLGLILLLGVWPQLGSPSVPALALTGVGFASAFTLLILAFTRKTMKLQTEIRAAERRFGNEPQKNGESYRYTSSSRFLGLPLIAIDFDAVKGRRARAWFAFGTFAQGGLLAVGQVAIAPIALGTASIGIVALGAASMGVVTFAGLATGVFAIGGFAIGYDALAGAALAYHLAGGGVAWAHAFAEGGKALALHANDAAAFAALQTHPVFQYYALMPLFGAILAAVSLLPGLFFLRRAKSHSRNNAG